MKYYKVTVPVGYEVYKYFRALNKNNAKEIACLIQKTIFQVGLMMDVNSLIFILGLSLKKLLKKNLKMAHGQNLMKKMTITVRIVALLIQTNNQANFSAAIIGVSFE